MNVHGLVLLAAAQQRGASFLTTISCSRRAWMPLSQACMKKEKREINKRVLHMCVTWPEECRVLQRGRRVCQLESLD